MKDRRTDRSRDGAGEASTSSAGVGAQATAGNAAVAEWLRAAGMGSDDAASTTDQAEVDGGLTLEQRQAIAARLEEIRESLDRLVLLANDVFDLREGEDLLDLEEDLDEGLIEAPEGPVEAVIAVIRSQREGDAPSAERLAETRALVEELSDQELRDLYRALDEAGVILEAANVLYGREADPDGPGEQVEIPVANWRFWNADDVVDAGVERANDLFAPHGIYVVSTSNRVISESETRDLLGHDVDDDFGLDRSKDYGTGGFTYTHDDMVAVVDELGLGGMITGVWADTVINDRGVDLAGTSMHTDNSTHDANIAFVATEHQGEDTFAHELGHILTREGHVDGDDNNLMRSGRHRDKDAVNDDRLTDDQIDDIKGDVLSILR